MTSLCRAAVLAFTLATLSLNAAVYYVSTFGNDSTGNGSSANPWRTICYGMERMAGGDTLVLRAGEYRENPIGAQHLKSGPSNSQRTTIKSYPGERAICAPLWQSATTIDHAVATSQVVSNITFDGWTIDMRLRVNGEGLVSRGSMIRLTAQNFALTNMIFINKPEGSGLQFVGKLGDVTRWSSNVHIVSCTFSNWNFNQTYRDATGHPIYTWNTWHSTIENNLFTEGKTVAIQYGSTELTGTTSDLTIRNNRIMAGPTGGFKHGIWNNSVPATHSTNTWIFNNVISGISEAGIRISGQTNYVYNNTIFYSGTLNPRGIWIRGGNWNYVANNIVWGVPESSGGHSILLEFGMAWLSNNIAGPKLPIRSGGTLIEGTNYYGASFDPLFLNAPGDLGIADGSPARANALNYSSVFNCYYDYSQRLASPADWDIGACPPRQPSPGSAPATPIGFQRQLP